MDERDERQDRDDDRGADTDAVVVELCYSRDRRSGQRRVIVRTVEGRSTLWVGVESDGPAALRAAARALAACEARGWTIAKIEPFPWANELRTASANDDGASPVERATRRTRSGGGRGAS